MPLTLITVIDLLGTFAFAISGIRIASGKQIDWFGAYIIGLVTAIGGGTLRDLLLDESPFWMLDGRYFLVTGVALVVALVFKNRIFRWGRTLFLFDAIGLGLFTIVGVSKSVDAGLPLWVCIVMGTITGSVGGVIRDILLNDVPLIFRKDIYALTTVVGGIVFLSGTYFGLSVDITAAVSAVTVIALRLIAVKFHVHLPRLELGNSGSEKQEDG